jgi:uncharacterized protein DUF5681
MTIRAFDYKVGYGKPPVETRFKKGNTANLRGRTAGSKNLATMLGRALDEPVVVAEDDGQRTVTKRELVVLQLVDKSAQGDLRATKLLFDILRVTDPRTVAAPADEAEADAADAAIERVRAKLVRLLDSHPAAPSSDDPPAGN